MKHLLLAALLLTLAGCGFYHWSKPGADDAAFQKDNAECQQQSPQGGWQDCMQKRGWTYTNGW